MATLALVISLAALLASSSAQTVSAPGALVEKPDDTVWSSVSYIFHGEKTPLRGLDVTKESLTPFGAHQMYNQGSAFRTRYLTNDNVTDNDDGLTTTTHATIRGLGSEALDSTMVSVASNSDSYVSTSALAFMQGLYPPKQAFAERTGGVAAADLANGTLVNWPLDGYQYPDMDILSVLDPNSVWIEGHVSCTRYLQSALHFTDDPTVSEIYGQTKKFYHDMYVKIFTGVFPESTATFSYAHDLYEYAAYQYNHDAATRAKMTTADLAMLSELAATQQRELNGNLTFSGVTEGDMIRAISGRMLAGKVLDLLKQNMATGGATNKMNLLFGSFEPFLAFFALSGLINGPSSQTFEALPQFGAAMTFELFSLGGNATAAYPAHHDLWVRFLYRNGSLPGTPFVPYPLFGNGNSQARMRYADFASAMQAVEVDGVAGWCTLCGSINLFCEALGSDPSHPSLGGPSGSKDGNNNNNDNLNPVVAGVIGAGVALGGAGLLFLGSVLFGGVRCYKPSGRGSLGGGFKGAQKMASDDDLGYAKGGARHERTSSWELRNAAAGATVRQPENTAVSTVSAAGESEGDGISIMEHVPVVARETM